MTQPTVVGDESVAPTPVRDQHDRADPSGAGPDAADGLLRVLAHGTLDRARADGPVSAARDLLRAETFLRCLRRHLLQTPREARGDSFDIGLMMIELMIARESLCSPGRPLPF